MSLLLVVLFAVTCAQEPAPCPAWQPPALRGRVEDEALREVSGLAASRMHQGILWALQDSGGEDRNVLWALHHDGRVAGKLTVDAPNQDWEALAVGPCSTGWCLFVGDIGDNTASRPSVAVMRIPEPVVLAAQMRVTPEVLPARYPDGPQDAEALVVTPAGEVVVLTKRSDGTARIMLLDASAQLFRDQGGLDVSRGGVGGLPSAVTDASLSPQGTVLLVRTYLGAWEFFLPNAQLTDLSTAARDGVPFVPQLQTEAVAQDLEQPGYWQMAEGPRPRMWLSRCLVARSSYP